MPLMMHADHATCNVKCAADDTDASDATDADKAVDAVNTSDAENALPETADAAHAL